MKTVYGRLQFWVVNTEFDTQFGVSPDRRITAAYEKESTTLERKRAPKSFAVGAILALIFGFLRTVDAQAVPAGSGSLGGASSEATAAAPAGIIPAVRGFNLSLGVTSQHDSNDGWSSILTPGVAYRFNSVFSLDASVPVYGSIDVQTASGPAARQVYTSSTKYGVLGDAAITATMDTHPGPLDYSASASVGLPSGNTAYGLGSGHVSYFVNNHVEKSLSIFSPSLEVGITDSSSLIGTRGRKDYTAAGTLLHFQAGTSVDLPGRLSLEVDAYEEMPISIANVYATAGRGKKKTTTIASSSAAEDNGINTALDLPFRHVTFSTFYNHSIRSSDDVAGLSLTFLLKAPPEANHQIK